MLYQNCHCPVNAACYIILPCIHLFFKEITILLSLFPTWQHELLIVNPFITIDIIISNRSLRGPDQCDCIWITISEIPVFRMNRFPKSLWNILIRISSWRKNITLTNENISKHLNDIDLIKSRHADWLLFWYSHENFSLRDVLSVSFYVCECDNCTAVLLT